MAILLTGIPGSGKTIMVKLARELYDFNTGNPLATFSCGDALMEAASKDGYDSGSLPHLQRAVVQGYRSGVPSACALALERQKKGGATQAVVETPLTEYARKMIEDTFGDRDFDLLSQYPVEMPIERVMCAIDGPRQILKNIPRHPINFDYKNEEHRIERVLDWTHAEVKRARRLAAHYTPGKKPLIVPQGRSELVKFLLKPEAPIIYLAVPITHAKTDPLISFGIKRMRSHLQRHGIIINPIYLADQGRTEAEVEHTIYRDLELFVNQADIVVACFPKDVPSKGVEEELRHARSLGKTTVLVHPKKAESPFGRLATYQFADSEEFIGALFHGFEDQPHLQILCPKRNHPLAGVFGDAFVQPVEVVSDEELAAVAKSLEQAAG